MRSLINSQFGITLQRAAANMHCRTGAESWLSPQSAVISHPKAGRTWLRVLLSELGVNRVCFSHAGSGEQAALTFEALQQIVPYWHRKRILLLIRDPRDTVVSFYFQASRRSRIYCGSFTDFLRDPRFGIERVVKFNLLWLRERRQFASFQILTYEQLHEDTLNSLERASSYLSGKAVSHVELSTAVAKGCFEELHKIELSGDGRRRWGFRLAPGDLSDPESFKTRRGIVGGWCEYFDADDRVFADRIFEQNDYFAEVHAAEDELRSRRQSLQMLSNPHLILANQPFASDVAIFHSNADTITCSTTSRGA